MRKFLDFSLIGIVVVAAILALLLPDWFEVTEGRAQEWVILGLLPALLWVQWVFWKKPSEMKEGISEGEEKKNLR